MALLFGLHRERPPQNWDPRTVERCQKVWWTVYILDRTFISSQGVPIASIQDHDITAPLPKTDVARENTIIHVYVKLARVTAEVVNSKHPGLRASPWPVADCFLERGVRRERPARREFSF